MSATTMLNELKKEFSEISTMDSTTRHMAFCKKLVASNDAELIDYHYELLKERNIDEGLYQFLRTFFDKRGPAGEDYLLDKIAVETDPVLRGDVLQMLGGMHYGGGKRLAETADWARKLVKSDADTLRCRAIWVLGWVGTPDDIDHLLADRLFHDSNNENRGWAATAMMQIFFTDKSTAKKSLGYLKQAIGTEKDYFALQMILVSIQEITGKRLGLKSSSHERAPKEKVDAALKKALKLLGGAPTAALSIKQEKGARVISDYLKAIARHYEQVWNAKGIVKHSARGPIDGLPAGFRILEFAPHGDRGTWTYSTCGMSQPGDKMPVEVHIFSDDRADELVELLTVVAHYHRTGASLWWGHTVNIGKPWLDNSKCTHCLLSLPYLDGEELEILEINQTMVRFLWLIPITEKECDYMKQFGLDKFEELLESREVDFSNPVRDGVI